MAATYNRQNKTGIRFVTSAKMRGAQFEFKQPLPCVITDAWDFPNNTLNLISLSRNFEQGYKATLGRGPRIEFQSPLTIRVQHRDTGGAAQGDSIASAGLDAFGDFAGAASGDAVASAEGASDAPRLPVGAHLLLDKNYFDPQRGRGEQLEITTPLTLTAPPVSFGDGAGAASGDAIAAGTFDAFGDFAGAASGDATASGTFTALGDFAGAAQGDSIAAATADDLADFAGAATGDSVASAGLDALADFAGEASGDATCDGFIEDATPVVVTPPVAADAGGVGQVFHGAWTDRIKKPKKKRLDELEEMIAELRSRIVEVPEPMPDLERTLRVSQALANNSENASLTQIGNQIVLLRAAINEIDDEEVIMLLAA